MCIYTKNNYDGNRTEPSVKKLTFRSYYIYFLSGRCFMLCGFIHFLHFNKKCTDELTTCRRIRVKHVKVTSLSMQENDKMITIAENDKFTILLLYVNI